MVSNKQKSDDAIFQECIQFHQSGDFEKAQKGFEYLISKYPENIDVCNSLGTLILQMGRDKSRYSLLKKSPHINLNKATNNLNLEVLMLMKKKLPYDLKLYAIKIKEVLVHPEASIKKGSLNCDWKT